MIVLASTIGAYLASAVAYLVLMPLVAFATRAVYAATSSAHPDLKQTALLVAYIRAELARAGLRRDGVTEQLLLHLPWVSKPVAWLAAVYLRLPAWPRLQGAARTLSALESVLMRAPALGLSAYARHILRVRTLAIDDALAASKASQLVILGAGFDTRCYSPDFAKGRRCFEVDLEGTQAAKREALAAAGVSATHVTFVAVDFNTESWLAKLVARGFDVSAPAFVVWEGVSYYLEPQAVAATAKTFAGLARGSVLAFDFFTEALVEGAPGVPGLAPKVSAMGEPLRFGIGRGYVECTGALQTWARLNSPDLEVATCTPVHGGSSAWAATGGVAVLRVPEKDDDDDCVKGDDDCDEYDELDDRRCSAGACGSRPGYGQKADAQTDAGSNAQSQAAAAAGA